MDCRAGQYPPRLAPLEELIQIGLIPGHYQPRTQNAPCRRSEVLAAFHGSPQGYLVGILQVTSNGQPSGRTGNLDPKA